MKKILNFPKNFLWGSATSSHQVEGNNTHNDWWKAEQAKELKFKSGKACDHYNRYEQDFDLIKSLNQNAHRFSIEWARIEPEKGKFDKKEIEHYRKVLLALKKRKIKTMVTLWHFTNPIWFEKIGGWSNKESADCFERYVKIIVEKLGYLVDFWVTINEPHVYIRGGYMAGNWPPFKNNPIKAINVFNNFVKAHKVSYKTIHNKYPKAKVSISKAVSHTEPARKQCILEKLIALLIHYFYNHLFLKKIENELDYIGINYYTRSRIIFYPPFKKNLDKKISDIGWEIYPQAIYHLLKYLSKFEKPIYITENGLADAQDKHRKNFIKDHLFYIHKAIEEGVDVQGYFHWSLMDNFEWALGFSPKFGLIEIDYKTMKRKPRPSANYYAKICKNNYLIK